MRVRHRSLALNPPPNQVHKKPNKNFIKYPFWFACFDCAFLFPLWEKFFRVFPEGRQLRADTVAPFFPLFPSPLSQVSWRCSSPPRTPRMRTSSKTERRRRLSRWPPPAPRRHGQSVSLLAHYKNTHARAHASHKQNINTFLVLFSFNQRLSSRANVLRRAV